MMTYLLLFTVFHKYLFILSNACAPQAQPDYNDPEDPWEPLNLSKAHVMNKTKQNEESIWYLKHEFLHHTREGQSCNKNCIGSKCEIECNSDHGHTHCLGPSCRATCKGEQCDSQLLEVSTQQQPPKTLNTKRTLYMTSHITFQARVYYAADLTVLQNASDLTVLQTARDRLVMLRAKEKGVIPNAKDLTVCRIFQCNGDNCLAEAKCTGIDCKYKISTLTG